MPRDKGRSDSENEISENEQENQDVELLSHPSYQSLLEKLNEADAKANDYWDRLLRLQAESENAARRAERDVSNAHKYALEKFITELLPIVDSLELSIANVSKDTKSHAGAVIEGVELTLKMFYNAMEKFGIKQINPLNEPFDPEFQQAISMQFNPKVPANTVISVLQKGYTLNNRLLRPALVVVSKAEE